MALDFSILREDGSTLEYVGIRCDPHGRLMELAASCGAKQLLRTHDFYEDVDFVPTQLPTLSAEIDVVTTRLKEDPELTSILQQLKELIGKASERQCGVTAIAD